MKQLHGKSAESVEKHLSMLRLEQPLLAIIVVLKAGALGGHS